MHLHTALAGDDHRAPGTCARLSRSNPQPVHSLAMTTPEPPRTLADAHAFFSAGRLRDAFNACGSVLAGAPDSAAALRLFGVILHESGYHAEASAYMERSLRIDPTDAAA